MVVLNNTGAFQKIPILAKTKIIFSDEANFDLGGYVNKQNCRIWGTENHARIHWKDDEPKTSRCLVRILVQRHHWAIFLRKWARRGRYSQWQPLSEHVGRIFVYKNWRGEYWQHLVSTGRRYILLSRSYTRCFALCFWRSHYQPQSCAEPRSSDLTPLNYYLWGAVRGKCYADEPETIDALKDNIREAIWWNTAANKR